VIDAAIECDKMNLCLSVLRRPLAGSLHFLRRQSSEAAVRSIVTNEQIRVKR
jgi:hypothetical protein